MSAAPLYQSSAPLYDGTGASGPIAAPPGAAAAPSLSGQRVNVIAPNGEALSIDVAELANAEAQGFKVETPELRGIRKYVEENKGLPGAAKVALRGLVDEATFGVADPIIDSQADPYELAKWQALKADHDIANIGGRAAGFGVSMLYGGEFFGAASKAGGVAARLLGREALEHAAGRAVTAELAYRGAAEGAKHVGSGVAKRILQNAADFGAQGLVLGAPRAMAQAITGDPERAAETWLWGGAAGAALGVPIGLASGVGGKIAARVSEGVADAGGVTSKLRKFGDEQAISALNMTKPFAKKLRRVKGGTEEAARIFRDHNLAQYAGDAPAMRDAVGGVLDEVGAKIGAVYDANGAVKAAAFEEIEGVIGKVLGEASKTPGKVGASKTVGRWAEEELLGTIAHDGASIRDLHDLRRVVDKSTRFDPTVANEVNELRKDIRSALTELLEKKLDSVGKGMGRELVAELRPLNKQYATLSVMSQAAEDNVARGMANSRHGLFGFIGNQVGSTVGGFVGGGAGSLLGGAVGGEVTNALRRYGPSYLAQGAHGLANALDGRGMVALEQAFASNAQQLERIPAALEAMSVGKRLAAAPRRDTAAVNVLTRFIGADQKIDTVEDVMAFSDRLASLASDPARAVEMAAQATEAISTDAPEVAAAAATKLAQAAMYLHDKAPKPPTVPGPFEPPSRWRPDAVAVRDFKTRVATAKDPYVAIDALMDGSLTKAHVETLQALAPKLYDEMIRRVMDYGASGKAKALPYAERLRLSMLTGAPLDRSLAQLAGYQQAFASPHATEETRAAAKLRAPETNDIQRVTG